ncbi:MAG TPA: uroporphyrinogen decarboxylase [Candidatus Acidoferrales bacterium]|nr:uroporphyrinogen decarboxylase [Candidatus Acidoferrales bacterium]
MNARERLLRACRSQPVERVPVWIMRQAGRALPGYRALRARHSFPELCRTPELAAQVSIEPLEALGVDAAIVFSDILLVPEAMGLALEVNDAGPSLGGFAPGRAAVDALHEFDPERETGFVPEAIRQIGRTLGPGIPVIGFAGAPWTVCCYMVAGQGGASPGERARQMLYAEPALARALLEKIARVTGRYLAAQIAAGAAVVQLFDTWAGELGRSEYEAFALPATRLAIEETRAGDAPVILYARGAAHLLGSMARAGAQVLSVDWRVDLAEARRQLGPGMALQGNVDPCVLLASSEAAERAARAAVEKTGGVGHILNLGHGLLPATPVEHARAFVRGGREAPVRWPAA